LHFTKAKITAITTTVGDQKIDFLEEAASLGYTEEEAARLKKSIGLNTRYIVPKGVNTSDLCEQSALKIFNQLNIDPTSIDAVIMVTQTPDYQSPSTAIALQTRLGVSKDALAFNINLGCSGLIYGLLNCYSLIQSGLERVLLLVGDTASNFSSNNKSLTPLMGDAGAAILIEAGASDSYFVVHSDGSGEKALYIPHSGTRCDEEDEKLDQQMYMDGAAVFNFTLKVIPKLIDDVMEFSGVEKDDVDYFVFHQPNKYILRNAQKRLKIKEDKLPSQTQSVYGNQNSASIPGTINGFLSDDINGKINQCIFAGFGIGLSWGACKLTLEGIYAPPVEKFKNGKSNG
jgi:3-oxoacyl-[acyl-carrier-protein] synthase-3